MEKYRALREWGKLKKGCVNGETIVKIWLMENGSSYVNGIFLESKFNWCAHKHLLQNCLNRNIFHCIFIQFRLHIS